MLNSFRHEATSFRKTWQPLMHRSFRSPLQKRCRWIHSSGCSWRPRTDRLRMVGSFRSSQSFLCWKLLAGIPLSKVSGSKVGVSTGSMAHDCQVILLKDSEDLPRRTITGIATSLLAHRVSWFFNFLGPSVSIDSACSSSLVALDIACQSLRNRESSMVGTMSKRC